MSDKITVKIVQKGWEGYTGNLGTAIFEDGMAELTQLEAARIGATIQIVKVGEDEETVVNVAHNIVKNRGDSAEVIKPLKETTEQERLDEVQRKSEKKVRDSGLGKYSREALEAIADKEGIKGIREIATPLGLKSVSIAQLIDQILAFKED